MGKSSAACRWPGTAVAHSDFGRQRVHNNRGHFYAAAQPSDIHDIEGGHPAVHRQLIHDARKRGKATHLYRRSFASQEALAAA